MRNASLLAKAGGLLLSLLVARAADAATYHVAQDGSGDCTTIANCLPRLLPGDTLLVHAGTYNESLDGNMPSGASDTERVTIAAAPGETVRIEPALERRAVECGFTQTPQSYITIEGFTLTASNYEVVKTYGEIPEAPPPPGTPENAWCSHLRIQGNEITETGSYGVGTTGDAFVTAGAYLEIIDNDIHGNGYLDEGCWYHGWNTLYLGGSNNLVEGNWIHDNYGTGLTFWNSPNTYASDNTARYNLVHDNTQIRDCYAPCGGGIFCAGQYQSQDRCLIYNNIVYSNDSGIWLGFGKYTGGDGARVFNNTVVGNSPLGGIALFKQTNALVQNNVTVGNEVTYSTGEPSQPFGANDLWVENSDGAIDHNLCTADGYGASCTTVGDAGFADAAGNDFHLAAGSPAVDTGIAVDGLSDDFDRGERPVGDGYDIGAFEYGSVPAESSSSGSGSATTGSGSGTTASASASTGSGSAASGETNATGSEATTGGTGGADGSAGSAGEGAFGAGASSNGGSSDGDAAKEEAANESGCNVRPANPAATPYAVSILCAALVGLGLLRSDRRRSIHRKN